MFKKFASVSNKPQKPLMIWDGACGFCAYWIQVWKNGTGRNVDYRPYQKCAEQYPDIPVKEFKKASRFIETDGKVYHGPDSAYKSLCYYQPHPIYFLHNWYQNSSLFRRGSDHMYILIAKNRALMMTLTKLLWGSNPSNRKPYWLFYLLIILIIATMVKTM